MGRVAARVYPDDMLAESDNGIGHRPEKTVAAADGDNLQTIAWRPVSWNGRQYGLDAVIRHRDFQHGQIRAGHKQLFFHRRV